MKAKEKTRKGLRVVDRKQFRSTIMSIIIMLAGLVGYIIILKVLGPNREVTNTELFMWIMGVAVIFTVGCNLFTELWNKVNNPSKNRKRTS